MSVQCQRCGVFSATRQAAANAGRKIADGARATSRKAGEVYASKWTKVALMVLGAVGLIAAGLATAHFAFPKFLGHSFSHIEKIAIAGAGTLASAIGIKAAYDSIKNHKVRRDAE